MGARNEYETLGYYLTRLLCRWASTAAYETALVHLHRRRFVHGDPGDQAGPRVIAAYCETARGGPALPSAAFLARPSRPRAL